MQNNHDSASGLTWNALSDAMDETNVLKEAPKLTCEDVKAEGRCIEAEENGCSACPAKKNP
jgi:hypothetical protein